MKHCLEFLLKQIDWNGGRSTANNFPFYLQLQEMSLVFRVQAAKVKGSSALLDCTGVR